MKLNILSIEDSKKDFEIIQELLIDSGFDLLMHRVEIEQDFILSVSNQKYDVILVDFKLPEYDAFSALKKANEICPEIPIIIVSGTIGEESAIELIKQGASDYVLKDKPNRLPYAIKQALKEVKEKEIRKQAEEALKDNEIKYRTLTENIPDVVARFDRNRRHLYVNSAIELITGIAPEDFIGKTNEELGMPEEKVVMWNDILSLVFKTAKQQSFEFSFNTPNGICFFSSLVVPEFNKKSEVESVLTVARNITEQRNAENTLFESREILRLLFNSSIDAILLTDPDGKIFNTNPSASKMFGFSEAEICNLGWDSFVYSSEPRLVIASENQFKTGNFVSELYLTRKNGSKFPAEVSSSIFTDKDGHEKIGMIIRDISERKRSEEILKEKELHYRTLANSGQALIWTSGIDKKCNYFNQIWLQFTGRSLEQELGYGWTQGVHPEDIQRCIAIYKSSFDKHESFSMEYRLRNVNGEYRWLQDDGTPRYDLNGRFVGYIGHCLDITDRKQNELELMKSKDKAEESDRLKSAFLANISHEIRTPMNGILGFSELLKEPNLSGEEQQEFIRIIEKSGERMLNIINDIVDISKIESGIMSINVQNTNVNEILDFINDFFKHRIEEHGLQLICNSRLVDSECIIKTDKEKVYAILTNLIKNSIKYTNEGIIKFGVEKKDSYLVFYVKDTGIGIPKERQDAIFERFIQADIADKMALQGAGLGLSISKAYVEMLGGKIWVESEEGKGSIFYFTIPCNFEIKDVSVYKDQGSLKRYSNRTKKCKILIVDDDEISVEFIKRTIVEYDNCSLIASTGFEAINLCRNNPEINIILMDLQMPNVNGFEATRQIRHFNKNVVIIAQTALAFSGDRERALEAGCNDYITKPIKKKELIDLIKIYIK